jgi:ribosomal protein S18 acetylase RimI-like enzyme
MAVIALPRVRIEPLSESTLDQAAVFLLKQWRDTYRDKLPAGIVDARSAGYFRDYLSQRDACCRLAWLDRKLVGLVATRQNCIEDLWVAKRYRGRGIARSLLQAALDDLRARGYQFAQAGCEDFNGAAIAFFNKSGWRHIGGEPVQIAPGMRIEALVFSQRLAGEDSPARSGT